MRRIGLRERVLELERALTLAAREAAWETLGSEKGITGPFEVALRCVVEPGAPWRISCSLDLEEQIRDAMRDITVKLDVLRQGRLYCYRCESSSCEHSVPTYLRKRVWRLQSHRASQVDRIPSDGSGSAPSQAGRAF